MLAQDGFEIGKSLSLAPTSCGATHSSGDTPQRPAPRWRPLAESFLRQPFALPALNEFAAKHRLTLRSMPRLTSALP